MYRRWGWVGQLFWTDEELFGKHDFYNLFIVMIDMGIVMILSYWIGDNRSNQYNTVPQSPVVW